MEEGKFKRSEVHIEKTFTSNGRESAPGDTVKIRYVQHATHTVEKDQIWDKAKATFKGRMKEVKCSYKTGEACVQTWQGKGDSLVQLSVKKWMLPSHYVWYGVPDCKHDSLQLVVGKEQATEEEFRQDWKLESRYGMHSFVVNIHKVLQAYRESVGHCLGNITPRVVLRCGGTLLYRYEVCYVVIVTYIGDEIHDSFPPVTDPSCDDGKPPLFDWSPLLDDSGCYTEERGGYPTFTPRHKKIHHSQYWDQFVLAVHLPEGMEIDKDILVGGGPLDTVHDETTGCHKFRKYVKGPLRKCEKEEEKYKQEQARLQSQKRHAAQ